MNKYLKYLLLVLVVGLVAFKSVYFKKLSSMPKTTGSEFDAVAFSKKLWEEQLPARLDSAIELIQFIKAVQVNPDEAFSKHTNALGIGNYRYALVVLNGEVSEIREDELLVTFFHPQADSFVHVRLATEFIYGNAIRDASGLVDVKDFPNTMDLNNISEGLNKIVRTTVLPDFKVKVKKGDKITVTGAIEINKEHIRWAELEIIPVRLQINQ